MYRESKRLRRRRQWAERQIDRLQAVARFGGARWRLVGPAFVAAIAYVDPGNVATNTAAGSSYGFLLLWVVVAATLMAAPVQYLSARLGVLTGESLPAYVAARARSRGTRLAYWLQAEAVAIATDVAEIVGAAVALHLLFGMDLVLAGLVSGLIAMVILAARDVAGPRLFEFVCLVSLVVIGGCFVFGIAQVPPSPVELAEGLIPGLAGPETVLLAAGIVGATVMPHAVYLHSALTAATPTPRGVPVATRLRATGWDVGTAMLVAGTVNISMLVLGATALASGAGDSLDGAASALGSSFGAAASTAFAVALLVSGIASTAVGTHAGAVIMKGLVRRQVGPLTRRALTLVPALALLASSAEPLEVLIYSQVALALGLPFALVPLVQASFEHAPDGSRNRVAWVGAGVTAIVLVLDLALLVLML